MSSQLLTLQDYVRQLYGSLLIKLAKKKLNHSTLVAGTAMPGHCCHPDRVYSLLALSAL